MTISELKAQLNTITEAMREAVEAEWIEIAATLLIDAGLVVGDTKSAIDTMEKVKPTVQIEAGHEMRRNKGGWSGRGAIASNAEETIRREVADTIFGSPEGLIFKAVRKLEKAAKA